jgi:hypothetical protein
VASERRAADGDGEERWMGDTEGENRVVHI